MTTLRRQVKNMVKNYSEAEVKVREATSNDPWGPSSTLMSEISDLTYNIVALGEVMRMIWKRLNDHGKNWRHVYKSLVLLDYLIKNGNEKVAQQCKEHIVAIQTLKDFQYMDEQKDQGASVREKAKQLVNLLRDDERLKAERSKAFRARERYAQNAMGISSDNKIIYAPANPGRLPAGSLRTNGGGGGAPGSSYADPYGGAGSAPITAGSTSPTLNNNNLAPEIEAVRPSDANEEDLQIKLAIMLSQQEHEEEVQRKKADDVKLQIALEQSKSEGQPNGLVDLGDSDPWASSTTNGKNLTSQKSNPADTDSDEFFPPLSSLKAPAITKANNTNNLLNDPWAINTNNANLKPFSTNGADPWNNSTSPSQQQQQQQQTTNPWLPTNNSNNSPPVIQADPWSNTKPAAISTNSNKLDEFDQFLSNRVSSPSSNLTNANSSNTANDPFGDFFGSTNSSNNNSNSDNLKNSTNPWNNTKNTLTNSASMNDPFNSATNQINLLNSKAAAAAAAVPLNPTRKTPESFLGENSSLVNLENLIPARPKSTNPFGGLQTAAVASSVGTPLNGGSVIGGGLSTSASSGHLNNPFLAQQQLLNQKGPTISQLQQQSMFPFGQPGTTTTTTTNFNLTSMQPLIPTTGQLAQPLIIPPTNMAFQSSSSSSASNNQPTSTTNPFLMM